MQDLPHDPPAYNNPYDSKKWVYYSSLIPGYVEKYGINGIRERNRKLLKKIEHCTDPLEREHLMQLLIENNLPLAKYIAERWRINHHTTAQQAEDDFQETCIHMIKYIRNIKDDDFNPSFFQIRLYYAGFSAVYYPENHNNTIEALSQKETFDELIHTPEEPIRYNANVKLLTALTRIILGQRSAEILNWYYFGNDEYGINPENTEQIAEKIGLTRTRVSQILNKTLDKLSKYVHHLIYTEKLLLEDFIIETSRSTEKPWSTPPSKESAAKDTKRSFLEYKRSKIYPGPFRK